MSLSLSYGLRLSSTLAQDSAQKEQWFLSFSRAGTPFESPTNSRTPIYNCKMSMKTKKKIITSADVQFSSQNQVKTKRKGHADVQFSSQNQVKTKKKKVITSADVKFSSQSQVRPKKRSSRPQMSNSPCKIK